MMRICLLVLCAVALALLGSAALGIPASGIVNVKDFGATGDGATDDTAAIKSAMQAASISVNSPSPIGAYFQVGPTLLFPAGVYLVSDEILVSAMEIRGEGQAAIQQTNPEKDTLVSKSAWQMRISNLTFLGGRSGINLFNPNVDTGQIIIDRCRFYGTAGPAIHTSVLSTSVELNDCEFIFCKQAWINERSDQAVMRDCWIASGKNVSDQAVIVHKGARLVIENLIGVPIVGAMRLRWIDNYGWLTCKHCRFGGEGGGFTPVYNFVKYPDGQVIMDDCRVGANSSYNANCAVYCLEVPSTIRIRDCFLEGSTGIILDKKIDLQNYFVNCSPKMLTYSIEGCTGEFIGEVPAALRKPVVKTAPLTVRVLTTDETKAALAKIAKEWQPKSLPPAETKHHKQRTAQGSFVELTDWSLNGFMDATTEKLVDRLALGKAGHDTVVLYRRDNVWKWPHVIIRGTVDLDKYPWLTWRQLPGTAPGSFAMKAIDLDSGDMRVLYSETFNALYDYYAENLKALFGGGVRRLEIRWYPLGWEQKSALESDFVWAQPGQYVVMDFMRMEAD